MQSGGRAARPCGHLGLSAGPGLDVVLAQNAPLEAERPWVLARRCGFGRSRETQACSRLGIGA
jgi:hypothetical protein